MRRWLSGRRGRRDVFAPGLGEQRGGARGRQLRQRARDVDSRRGPPGVQGPTPGLWRQRGCEHDVPCGTLFVAVLQVWLRSAGLGCLVTFRDAS